MFGGRNFWVKEVLETKLWRTSAEAWELGFADTSCHREFGQEWAPNPSSRTPHRNGPGETKNQGPWRDIPSLDSHVHRHIHVHRSISGPPSSPSCNGQDGVLRETYCGIQANDSQDLVEVVMETLQNKTDFTIVFCLCFLSE